MTGNNVTIDLNGFSIVGPRVGIRAASQDNISVANGSVLDATTTGIRLGNFGHVDRVRLTGPTGLFSAEGGIVVGDDAIVSGCSTYGFSLEYSRRQG